MRHSIVAALAVLLFAASATAQQAKVSADEKAKIRADVTATVNTYLREVFSGTPKGVINTFSQPSFGVGGNGVVANEPARQETTFEALGKRFKTEGWVGAIFRPLNICVMTPYAAIAAGNLYRTRADRSEHLIQSESILLAGSKDGWKIVTIFAHEPEKFLTCPD